MPSSSIKQFPVEEEYKKNKEITPQDVSRLRDWLKTQPHLPEEYITDLDIVLTYHSCKFSSEVTKQLLDTNYTLRTLSPAYFKDRKLDDRARVALKTILYSVLPTRSQEGYVCFNTYFMDWNVKNFCFGDVVRAGFMVIDLWQYEVGTCPGFIIVIDMEGMVLGHLASFELHLVQQFVYYLQEGLTVQMKGLHFTSAPSFMDKFLALLKPFMKKELLSMLYVHQVGSRTLDEFYPINCLPTKTEKLQMQESLQEKLESNPEFFVNENKKRVVESKRPGKPKTATDVFGGIEGSFKKLDID